MSRSLWSFFDGETSGEWMVGRKGKVDSPEDEEEYVDELDGDEVDRLWDEERSILAMKCGEDGLRDEEERREKRGVEEVMEWLIWGEVENMVCDLRWVGVWVWVDG
jgi:hypothetical protein